MYRSAMVACLALVFLVGMSVTGLSAQQAKRGQQQGARGNKADPAAANANANPAVQMLLQQFDKNGNGALDGEELVQVAATFQQLIMGRAVENGAAMGGAQGGAGQGLGNQGGMQGAGGRGFGAMGQGFGAAGQSFGQGNGGKQQKVQNRFQQGQGGAGNAGRAGNGGR